MYMKKLLFLLLLSPLTYSEDVFLECNASAETDPLGIRTLNFHIQLDKQLVKSRGEYVKYTQGTNGVITWQEVTKYDDGTWIANAYFIDRTNLSLDIVTEYSYKSHESLLGFTCNKKEIEF